MRQHQRRDCGRREERDQPDGILTMLPSMCAASWHAFSLARGPDRSQMFYPRLRQSVGFSSRSHAEHPYWDSFLPRTNYDVNGGGSGPVVRSSAPSATTDCPGIVAQPFKDACWPSAVPTGMTRRPPKPGCADAWRTTSRSSSSSWLIRKCHRTTTPPSAACAQW